MSRPRLAILSLIFSLIAASLAHAAPDFPRPSPYPVSWELKFTHAMPKRIVVDVPTSASPVAYYYMTYSITNTSDKEQMFLPQFDLLTDQGKVVRSDVNIPSEVFAAVKNAEHNKFLEPITSITGQIRLGEAEARDGVAIWPEPLPRMGHFAIFATGLSGEAITIKQVNGSYQKVDQAEDMKEMKDLIILRKTLQLNFHIRGDEVYPGEDEVNSVSEEWIMR